ncbi:MAG: glycosyltransferase family 2 protein [Candidatus Harrisonbacteria bacterium]|nr:glycosyltransferase family 2 protein [Candidatus Harrisonbacteria bacterium]
MRQLEIIPGVLAWLTLILVIVFSWQLPAIVAVFIILFDIYWLLRTIYLIIHLRDGYRRMKQNLKTDWIGKLEGTNWRDIYHLIILPMYQEPHALVKETLESLKNNKYPKDRFLVVIAAEEKAGAASNEIADRLAGEYKDEFYKIFATHHPAGLTGEIPGKGSNSAWAGNEAKKVVDQLKIPYENVLVSVFDVDTQVFPDYFGCLAWNFFNCENPQRSSFQPIPLFTNNIYQAPAPARVVAYSATFWQLIVQTRPDRLVTFSSHSMPFKALVEIGFWQKNVVSEDSRIFWQCYLHYNGDWRVTPLLYPISMDANVAPSFWKTMVNTYKQQRRWAYGAENIPFIMREFSKNRLIPLRKKFFWVFQQIEGMHSWATNAFIIFALGWLPLLLGGQAFNYTVLAYNLPNVTRLIMAVASIGIATSAVLALALLPKKPDWFRPFHYVWYLVQWLLTPLVMVLLGSLPALEAHTRLMLGGKFKLGFWVTPKSRT